MAGWHCRLNGHKLGQILGGGEGQGGLAYCRPRARKGHNRATKQHPSELSDLLLQAREFVSEA